MKHERGLAILLGLSLVFWPQGVVLANTQTSRPEFVVSHPGIASALHSRPESDGWVQDLIYDSGVASGHRLGESLGSERAPQNDEKIDRQREKKLVLSLPFATGSHWTSVSDNIPGITWQTASVPLLPEEGLGEEGVIKFGIKNGQFIANATDTWFVYGWFGALKAIKQPYNIKYPEWGDRHNGIDFAGKEGLEIISTSTGKVIFAGQKIGNTVIIDAGNNYQITYGHLQDISVKRGQILQIGDPVGHLGKTGTVNPHLHFQVDLIDGSTSSPLHRTAINPVPLFDAEWGNVIIPTAEANQFYTDNQDPLTQPDFIW